MADKPQVEPYDFVPFVGKPERKPPVGHLRYVNGRHGGLLECRLTVKTPLFVYDPRFVRRVDQGHETVDFPVFQDVAVISGASLKGVIRSVVEAVEPCCFILPSPFPKRYRGAGITRDKEITVRLPGEFEHCELKEGQKIPRLCPACRLFGSLKGEMAYAGKVSIGDVRSAQGAHTLMTPLTLDVLSTPKPEGRPRAYRLADGQTIKGRKFYRHRYPPSVLERVLDRSGRPKRDQQNKTVRPVGADSVFHFAVEYSDLDDEELRLLLYALALEEGLWHKVGLGKPIGMGSVQIEIVEWTKIDRQARYRLLGGGVEAPLKGEALDAELAGQLRPYRQSQAENLKKLRDILRPNPSVDVRYIVRRPPTRDDR